MSTTSVVEDFVEVGGAKVHLLKGGEGPPLLFLHSIEGNLGWLPWMERIAESATVYAPTHPGFGVSERPELLESVSDMARFYLWFIQEMGLESVSLVGHFLGGWIAAEMATMSPSVLRNLVLVDAAGVRPKNAEIADIFLLGEEETTRRAFHDASSVPGYAGLFERDLSPEEREARVRSREMTTRLSWKPYMYDRSLIWLLQRVNLPTLVVWGADDAIIPVDSGRQIHEAIPGSRLEIVRECGHLPHVEKPDEFSRLVLELLAEG
jgi:pimeloyl-ACP methyl ester carboxylesterase